ncbi:MAG: SCP2 sterol-binding domain-containing protein [Actinomycetes bacterium]
MRFLSSEWCAAWTSALEGLEVSPGADERARGLLESLFTVDQVVTMGDGLDTVVRMTCDHGVFSMARVDLAPVSVATVTVKTDYETSAAIAQGALDPAAALSQGSFKVSGDLSALIAAQKALRAAADRLSEFHASTSFS